MLISIVTPALEEAETVPVRGREIACQEGPYEWIVSDGGSSDATVARAQAAGAIVVASARGRGVQLDSGAARATGDVLLFLHADTALPVDALAAVRRALGDPDIVGGNFTLRFDEGTWTAALFAAVYALQQRLFGVYFGDSAIFIRRETFDRVRGFGNLPIMEDYEFVRKLARAGRVVKLGSVVTTSARRYRGKPVRSVCLWFAIALLYRAGVPPRRLRALYAPHAARVSRNVGT